MEDFVPFLLAKKLKEKGFTCEYPFAMYTEYEQFCPLYSSDKYYFGIDDFDKHDYIAPTIYQVLKWLREEKKLVIVVRLYKTNGWYWFIQDEKGELKSSYLASCDDCFQNYELATIAGIEYVIDNLI